MSRFFSRVTTTSESKETVLIKKHLQFHNWKVMFFSTCVSGSVSPVRRNTVSFGEDSRKTVAGVSLLTLQVY